MIVKETWDQGMRKALSANGIYFYCLFNDFHGFFTDFYLFFNDFLCFVSVRLPRWPRKPDFTSPRVRALRRIHPTCVPS